jgi:hypothetical protein
MCVNSKPLRMLIITMNKIVLDPPKHDMSECPKLEASSRRLK